MADGDLGEGRREDPGVDERLLVAHLDACSRCRSFAAAIDGSRRRLTVQMAPDMPDLSRQVSKLNAVADRASRWSIVRVLLVVVAIEVIVLSAPALFDSDNHDARHLGAFSVAYGVSLLVVVVRPARARTVLPVAVVLAGALLITAVVDLAARCGAASPRRPPICPNCSSVLLVWMLTVPAPRRRATTAPVPGASAPALRVVRNDSSDADDDRHAV